MIGILVNRLALCAKSSGKADRLAVVTAALPARVL
jgi:hypothetical protein